MNAEECKHFMAIALREAKKGLGRTSPNPCVGAVIVNDDREIVGTGYHHRAGEAHAEVNAIHDAGERARGATIFVTLEPCNHTGRTPPCTEGILKAGIDKVVIGMADPNPQVAGGGAAYLTSRGVDVQTGVLEQECRALVRPFLKHSATGLPWVVMKAGMSLDGRISYQSGRGGAITGEESRYYTHSLRNELDAILIGAGTALVDDPSLTTRLPQGEEGRDPLRVVLDTHLRLQPDARMLNRDSAARTYVFCGPEASAEKQELLGRRGAVVKQVAANDGGGLDLREVLLALGGDGVSSVLVEGGAEVHGSFLRHDLVDEFYLFTAPFFIGEDGTPLLRGYAAQERANVFRAVSVETKPLGADLLIRGLVNNEFL